MAQSASDKRRFPRVGAPKVVVRIPSADRFRSHYLKDLSEGGLFIRAAAQLPVGSELSIELWPPDAVSPLQLPAKVLRAVTSGSTGFDGEPGMAVAFTAVSPEDARRLKALIDAHGEELTVSSVAENPLGQVQRMMGDLAEARRQNAVFQEEVSHLREELTADAEHFRKVEFETAAAQSAFAQVVARRDQLETDQSTLEAALAQVTARRDQLETEARQLRVDLAAAVKLLEVERSGGQISNLQSKIEELTSELDAARSRDREMSKLLSGTPLAASTGSPKPGRKPQAQIIDEEIVIEKVAVETPISTESVEFAFDQMAGNEEPTATAPPKNPGVTVEPLFASEEIDFVGSLGAKPPRADPLASFLDSPGLDDERTDVQVSVEVEPPGITGGLAGFVIGESIVDGRKPYDLFAKELKRTTRLMPTEELGKRKPGNVDEALLSEMLSASPTFGTVLTQMGSQVKEERLRQMLYELYARALLDLREY